MPPFAGSEPRRALGRLGEHPGAADELVLQARSRPGGKPIGPQARLRVRCELPRQLLGGRARGAVGDDAVREPDREGLLGADRTPGQDEVESPGEAEEARQQHGAAVDKRDAEAAVEDAEDRVLVGDPQVAPERELESARDRIAGDGGDHRLREQHPRRAHRPVAVRLEPVRERLQVRSRAESATGAEEHGDRRIRFLERAKGVGERLGVLAVDGVAHLRPVEDDGVNGAVALDLHRHNGSRWERLFAGRTRGEVGEGIAAVLSFLGLPNIISFAGGFPDPRTFPRERVSALLEEFTLAGEVNAFQYTPTRGLAGPLDALAGRLEALQGCRPADEELMVTSGAIEALELVGKSFLERGDVVVVEDVAYRELGFEDDAAPSLWSLAPDVVVQAGTTSKTFFPGVRLGWAVGPADVLAQLVSAKQNTDQCAGALGQRLFEEYVRRGWIDEQLAQSRSLYRRKCDRMLAALERGMPAGTRWTCPRGGFFTWLTLPEGGDAADLAKGAVERGVGVAPGSLFFPDGRGGDSVRLSFSQVDESSIDEGIERLASLVAP